MAMISILSVASVATRVETTLSLLNTTKLGLLLLVDQLVLKLLADSLHQMYTCAAGLVDLFGVTVDCHPQGGLVLRLLFLDDQGAALDCG